MARKNPIPEREIVICRRVRKFRLGKKLSRVALAEELGVGISRLSNYESGRVPLPYRFAATLCSAFDINQEWLADGVGPMHGWVMLDPKLEADIRPRQLFTFIFDDLIKPSLAEKVNAPSVVQRLIQKAHLQSPKTGIRVESIRSVGTIGPDTIQAMLVKGLCPMINGLPPPLRLPFYSSLIAAFHAFEKKHSAQIEAYEKYRVTAGSLKIAPIPIDNVTETVKLSAVKPMFQNLLKRLKDATSARGKKSELANYLHVSLVQVSQWLSGDRKPGGETTLQMLHWVELQERQK